MTEINKLQLEIVRAKLNGESQGYIQSLQQKLDLEIRKEKE